jgi:hypothetical protein
MMIVKCPNCNIQVDVEPEFLGRQVGCVKCRRMYILSLQYHDEKYRRLVIINTVLLSLIFLGVFIKIEADYSFIRRNAKAINKAVKKKHNELFVKPEVSDELLFFDFDSAYGDKEGKLKRTGPIVLPEHKGRIVEWTGEIAQIIAVTNHPYGKYYIKFKQSDASSSDVTVYFRGDQAESLGKLQVGHYIKFQAVIVSAGYGNTDHILRRGKILE